MFEHILLDPEQEELLAALVEAARNVPRNQRQKFEFFRASVLHPGLAGGALEAYAGNLEILAHNGLLALSYGSRGSPLYDVTPEGFEYYRQMKEQSGQPLKRVENTVRDYLTVEHFQRSHAEAYQKWSQAESMLWASDSERQLTTIGHLCREVLQAFATTLVNRHQPPDVDQDVAHIVSRIRAVLELRTNQIGSTEKPFLDALLAYWGTVSDLVQRQEHGAQKEGGSLVWEDGRRIVFQTAIVMFEIDRSLSRTR